MFEAALPLADVCPGCHHVVVDLCDLVCVVIGIQGQQFVSKGIGLIHLTLPLLQLFQKHLKGGGGEILFIRVSLKSLNYYCKYVMHS